MELKELSKRAMEVRSKYSELEIRKYGKEWTNAQIMEGFVGDVGDLMKVIMAKEGIRDVADFDKKLSHELVDCLWCILVLASRYGLDMEKIFFEEMDKLDKRISKIK